MEPNSKTSTNKVRVEIFGKTFGFRDQIKAMGLRWNFGKKIWMGEVSIEKVNQIKQFVNDKDQIGYTIYGKAKETKLPSVKPKQKRIFTPIMGRGRQSIAFIDTLKTQGMRMRSRSK
jgi:hypothetical protein